jgi:nucleoside-diphosphate-sugar epimerase
MNILLTGATGFIGSHVARALLGRSHTVHAIARPGGNRDRIADIAARLQLLETDLLSPDTPALPDSCDAVIHLAWYVEPRRYLSSPINLDWLCASLRLARAAAAAGCRRFLAAGTCFEYALESTLRSESTPTRPASVYAASKLALFTALEQFCDDAGISFAWMRFFYQYGPHEHPARLVPIVINTLLRDQPVRLNLGEQVRDFLHVDDVATAVCALAENQLAGAVNIGSGRPVTVRQLAESIAALIGRPDRLQFGAQPYAPADPMHVVADNRKLLTATAWRPRHTLETGLRDTIAWWQTRLRP